ncbi:MAG: methyltransferase domain-containing protein [Bauldia sp.]|nr:methyltransferase domain-containing protein [Bauldia sp.]
MPELFDLRLLDHRRHRAAHIGAAGADFLFRRAAEDILDRLAVVTRRFPVAVDLLSPLPFLPANGPLPAGIEQVVRLDRLPAAGGTTASAIADGEAIPLRDGSVDLVVSVLGLQTVNDLPGALAQIRRALKPDGLFLAVLLGGDSLAELRAALAAAEVEERSGASPRVAPFGGVRELGALLQRAQFGLPVADADRVIVRYADALALMHDLRAMGATNILVERDRRPLTRAIVAQTAAIYAERFADPDGRVRATFDLVSLSGWAPHQSQQKPLRPGSAQARLADALNASEFGTGDKARPG